MQKMRRSSTFLLSAALLFFAIAIMAFAGDGKSNQSKTAIVTAPAKTPSTVTGTAPVYTPPPPVAISPATVASPMAGEQIKWQVLSGGGTRATSTGFIMDATLGQTAAGMTASVSYKLNQGFWQSFSAGSCCLEARGSGVGAVRLDTVSARSWLVGSERTHDIGWGRRRQVRPEPASCHYSCPRP